eukprot:gene35373-43614_t
MRFVPISVTSAASGEILFERHLRAAQVEHVAGFQALGLLAEGGAVQGRDGVAVGLDHGIAVHRARDDDHLHPGPAQRALRCGRGRRLVMLGAMRLAQARRPAWTRLRLLRLRLQVESEVGHGSVFRFALTLPLAEAPRALPAADAPGTSNVLGLALHERGKRVLVADDDRESQLLLGELLEPLGFVVAFASNGVEALARVASFAPHLVLMDWRMPELDGLATIRRMRGQPDCDQVRIIMCTASAFEEQCELALQAGADAFLRKPLDTAELYAHIEQLLGLRFLRAACATESAAGGGMKPVLKEELAGLPAEVRKALKEGAVELDQQRLAGALAAVERECPNLAQRLRHMTQAFRYRELFALLS